MIDPSTLASGVVTSIATSNVEKQLGKFSEGKDPVVELLSEIRDLLAPPEKDSINEPFQLSSYPSEYIVPDDFHNRAHVCVFFYASNVPVRFDGVYGGSYTRNIGPGWFQLDVPGRLSLQSGNNQTPVVVSYRDDALGSSF